MFFLCFPGVYSDDPGCDIRAWLSNVCECKQSARQLTSSAPYLKFGARQLEPCYLKEAGFWHAGASFVRRVCYESKKTRVGRHGFLSKTVMEANIPYEEGFVKEPLPEQILKYLSNDRGKLHHVCLICTLCTLEALNDNTFIFNMSSLQNRVQCIT